MLVAGLHLADPLETSASASHFLALSGVSRTSTCMHLLFLANLWTIGHAECLGRLQYWADKADRNVGHPGKNTANGSALPAISRSCLEKNGCESFPLILHRSLVPLLLRVRVFK